MYNIFYVMKSDDSLQEDAKGYQVIHNNKMENQSDENGCEMHSNAMSTQLK